MSGAWTALLPVHIESVMNCREHWRKKAKRAKSHRTMGYYLLRIAMPGGGYEWTGPLNVTLVRVAPRKLDSDNLAAAFKACRDGVADALGIDDRDPRVTWLYDQRRGRPKEYAAEVVIKRREETAA